MVNHLWSQNFQRITVSFVCIKYIHLRKLQIISERPFKPNTENHVPWKMKIKLNATQFERPNDLINNEKMRIVII